MTDSLRDRLAAVGGTRALEDLPHRCRCGNRWSGANTTHCGSGCHRTFTGVRAFDRHRKGGDCANPATVGMVLAPGRAYEAWTLADIAEDRAA